MIESRKYISEEIKWIDHLSKTRKCSVRLKGEKYSTTGYLKKQKGKGFVLDIDSADFENMDVGDHVKLFIGSGKLNITSERAYIKNTGVTVTGTKGRHHYGLQITHLRSNSFLKRGKRYFRCVIPLKGNFTFHNILKDDSYWREDKVHSRGLINVSMNSLEYHVFVLEKDRKRYLVLDCLGKLSFESFSDSIWSITVALGYLTGHLAQDELYVFSYGNKHLQHFKSFSYETRRDSIKSFYTPINANPYSWIKSERTIAKSYYSKIKEISNSELSKLCQLIHDKFDIMAIILLITESLSRSLLLMPAGLSVALEGLSEYFSTDHPKTLKPIQDDKVAGQFRTELMEVLEKYKLNSKFSGYSIMSSKIANINAPTNRDKLRAPFTVLSIPLTKIDEEILEYRNDFLHGNINLNPKKGKKTYSMDSFEISLRLLTLLNMCIMKMAGYQGYIINHPKTQEKGLSKKIHEQYYREI